jgi:hypothetical protein
MMGSAMIDWILIVSALLLGILTMFAVAQILLFGRDLEGAIERTIDGFGGLVTGVISAGFLVAIELGSVVASLGDLIGMVAGTFSAGVIAILGVGSLSGLIEIGPELFALLAVIVIVVAHALGNGEGV